jgi:hypothetical protein
MNPDINHSRSMNLPSTIFSSFQLFRIPAFTAMVPDLIPCCDATDRPFRIIHRATEQEFRGKPSASPRLLWTLADIRSSPQLSGDGNKLAAIISITRRG